ncbi:hypothetical protein R1sor_015101 [Riccia sorocarpa]|uniref:Uncharacterized protein n=1 Tax=Riccia sorocarpa TaxID=122646 RepID=A0ABD3HDZ0_9MARC
MYQKASMHVGHPIRVKAVKRWITNKARRAKVIGLQELKASEEEVIEFNIRQLMDQSHTIVDYSSTDRGGGSAVNSPVPTDHSTRGQRGRLSSLGENSNRGGNSRHSFDIRAGFRQGEDPTLRMAEGTRPEREMDLTSGLEYDLRQGRLHRCATLYYKVSH